MVNSQRFVPNKNNLAEDLKQKISKFKNDSFNNIVYCNTLEEEEVAARKAEFKGENHE